MKRAWRKVKIFGRTIPVFRVPNLIDTGYYAYFEQNEMNEEGKIVIENALERERFDRILLHEMFHAAFEMTNMKSVVKLELEELIVDNCARVVMENFKLTWK